MAIESLGTPSSSRMQGSAKTYDAVFTDKKDNAGVKPSDFLNLMVAQMQNQDFLNPMDDAQFVTQMAQFTTMQQMMELAEWSKSTYAMSLVGKTVTASRFAVSGLDTTTGVVDRISFVDNEYVLYIGDKRYTLSQVMEVHASPPAADSANSAKNIPWGTDKPPVEAANLSLTAGEPTTNAVPVLWQAPVDDLAAAAELKYTVYYSTVGPFDTIEEVKRGTISGQENRKNILVETIVGLDPGTEYYINVLVKDPNGNETIYQPVKIMTKGGAAVGETGETDLLADEEEDTEVEEATEAENTTEAGEATDTEQDGEETPIEGQSPLTGETVEQ